ncbi:MAG: ribonuclease D [Gammaproteobacteria bacterium]|nr:ribonuclease D [Gammaproteobacteria bacterium]
MTADYLWIETDTALRSLAGRLRGGEWLAMDTEFMRERTYYPQLCLVQIAAPDMVACIDVLALSDLDPLMELLLDTALVKVLHSARQDLEMFFHAWGRVPAPIFDTQLAASFAGLPDQAGYATVVKSLLGVTLAKNHTRADWSRRPLTDAVRQYAADDVRYLRDIYLRLKQDLARQGRIQWLETEHAKLTDPATYRPDPAAAWQRVRGLQRLNPRQFAAAKLLAAWREQQAMRSNLPRQWIFKDQVLIDLARQRPANLEELQAVRGLSEGLVLKHGQELLTQLSAAREETPPEKKPDRLAVRDESLVDALMAVLKVKADAEGVSPVQLATRRDLEQLVRGQRDLEVLKGWRLQTAGRDLLDFMQGKTRLAVLDAVLQLDIADPEKPPPR